jgi:hypothetical protein
LVWLYHILCVMRNWLQGKHYQTEPSLFPFIDAGYLPGIVGEMEPAVPSAWVTILICTRAVRPENYH